MGERRGERHSWHPRQTPSQSRKSLWWRGRSLFHSVPVSASLLVRFPLREPAWRSDGVVSPPLTYSYDSPQASAAKEGSENEEREGGGLVRVETNPLNLIP
jgi:hypothetical protein